MKEDIFSQIIRGLPTYDLMLKSRIDLPEIDGIPDKEKIRINESVKQLNVLFNQPRKFKISELLAAIKSVIDIQVTTQGEISFSPGIDFSKTGPADMLKYAFFIRCIRQILSSVQHTGPITQVMLQQAKKNLREATAWVDLAQQYEASQTEREMLSSLSLNSLYKEVQVAKQNETDYVEYLNKFDQKLDALLCNTKKLTMAFYLQVSLTPNTYMPIAHYHILAKQLNSIVSNLSRFFEMHYLPDAPANAGEKFQTMKPKIDSLASIIDSCLAQHQAIDKTIDSKIKKVAITLLEETRHNLEIYLQKIPENRAAGKLTFVKQVLDNLPTATKTTREIYHELLAIRMNLESFLIKDFFLAQRSRGDLGKVTDQFFKKLAKLGQDIDEISPSSVNLTGT